MHPTPVFHPDDRVTIVDDRIGILRLVVESTEPATQTGPGWVILTTPAGYGRWRRRADLVTRGWGN